MEAVISSAPKAPDPYATAAAQGAANKDAANYTTELNRVDTYTPYGSSVYKSTGTAADPHWQQTVNLTPEAQQQVTNELKQNNQLSELGFGLADQAKQTLGAPLPDTSQSRDAAGNAYYARQTAYLDPQWQHAQADQNSDLANKGVMEGSAAYTRAQDDLARQKEFAYGQARDQATQVGDSAQQTALGNALQARNLPLNELNALRTGSQVTNPTFAPTYTGGGAAAGDIQGNVYNGYNAAVQSANSFNSGLFSLAGAGVKAAFPASDRRLKENIRRVGETPIMRVPLYIYNYIGSKVRHVGVMAQEVSWAAVKQSDGYYAVNYGLVA